MKRKLVFFYNILSWYYHKILKSKNSFNVSMLKSVKMKLTGFTIDQYTLYNFKRNDSQNYITELERWKSREINGDYAIVLDDKLLFYEIFNEYLSIPKNLFWVKNNKLLNLKGGNLSDKELEILIKKYKDIFVKPVNSGGGIGVFKVSYEDGYFIDSESVSFEHVVKFIKTQDNVVGSPGISQHDYSKNIYPQSINTLRILTLYDTMTNTVSIPEAIHRFGNSKTGPVDNASRGGLFSVINVNTGVLTESKNYENEIYVEHPDTNIKIKGTKIPGWLQVKEEVINFSEKFPYIPFMAWDIVITKDGFEVIEINASTDITFFQMWEGKRNSELGKFYKSKGVTK